MPTPSQKRRLPPSTRRPSSISQLSPRATSNASAGATMTNRWLLGGFSVTTQPRIRASQNHSSNSSPPFIPPNFGGEREGGRQCATVHTIPRMNNTPLSTSSSGMEGRYQKVGSSVW